MRSSFFGIETMRRAILAHRRTLDVIGHNVANAATPGYTRQRVILSSTRPSSNPGINTAWPPGQIGTGVWVEEIRRVRDVFIDNQIRIGNGQKGQVEIEKETLRRIENIFLEPSSEEGFNNAMTSFFNSWQELSKRPENMAARQMVISTGQNLMDVFNHVDQQLRDIREDLNSAVQKDVEIVNGILKGIAGLNEDISRVYTSGDTPNDLMDKRDLLLDDLSKYLDITVEDTDTYGVAVYVNGRVLVRDQVSYEMTDEMAWDHPSQTGDPSHYRDVSHNDFFMLSNFMRGEFKGLTNSRDVIVTEVQDKFQEMVRSLMDEVNNQHSQGHGLTINYNYLNATTLTAILPAAAPLNRVEVDDITQFNEGDTVRIEDADNEAVTVKITNVVNAAVGNDYIEFEMIDPLQKPDDAAGWAALTNYTIGAGATFRKLEDDKFNFFVLKSSLDPQHAGDTSPDFRSRMTSAIDIPAEIDLNSTIAELEAYYGLSNLADGLTGTLMLDDNAVSTTINDNSTLRQAIGLITRLNLRDNEGKPVGIDFDEVNRRIILTGNTRDALEQLGGEDGSVSNLFRVLGFEGHSISGFGLPVGTNLGTTLQDLGVSTGWMMIDNTSISVTAADLASSLQNFLDKVNGALGLANSNTEHTLMFFDSVSNSLKIVSDHQFSTRSTVNVPSAPPVGNTNFLTMTGLQRDAGNTQDSTIQSKISVTTSDAAVRMKVNDNLIAAPERIAVSGNYSGVPGDNRIALKIAELKNINVLSDTATGVPANPTETVDEYYNNMISKVGADSQRAITDSDVIDRYLEYYNTRREEVSGVSVDEEMTKMIESQRAYQAAARMLNVVDEMLDRVINGLGLGGR